MMSMLFGGRGCGCSGTQFNAAESMIVVLYCVTPERMII